MNQMLLTYYGDDFTGSTDALEALTLGGVPSALFFVPPTADLVESCFPHIRALGVAGTSRAMSPTEMDKELPPVFASLQAFHAPIFHYKVCSTFDSSPEIGSIGRAIDIGFRLFAPPFVPVVVGVPPLRRYVLFGNLFATIGTQTFRLDRHPIMSRHPVTPMQESDLCRHLSQQTTRAIGLLDILALSDLQTMEAQLATMLAAQQQIIVFDTLTTEDLRRIGELIWNYRRADTIFLVGSSGVEYALTGHWRAMGLVQSPVAFPKLEPVRQMLVVSGSASHISGEQIQWGLANGFQGIRLNAPRALHPETAAIEYERACNQALDALAKGRSVILYSALGPEDPHLLSTSERAQVETRLGEQVGQLLGTLQGKILRTLIEQTNVRRVCVAGGDTCGRIVPYLDIFALEMIAPTTPGAPLCRSYSHTPTFDGLELSLKGGQVGPPDYFGRLLSGRFP